MSAFKFENIAIVITNTQDKYLRESLSELIEEYTPIYFENDYKFLKKISNLPTPKIILYSDNIDLSKLENNLLGKEIKTENIKDFIQRKNKAIPHNFSQKTNGKKFIEEKILNTNLQNKSILPNDILELSVSSFLFEDNSESLQETNSLKKTDFKKYKKRKEKKPQEIKTKDTTKNLVKKI